MPMAVEMITALSSLIDRMVKLLERGERRREVIFRDFVAEIYDRLEPVAQNYIEVHDKLATDLSAPMSDGEFEKVLAAHLERKAQHEEVRRSVERSAKTYGNRVGIDEVQLMLSLVEKFFVADEEQGVTWAIAFEDSGTTRWAITEREKMLKEMAAMAPEDRGKRQEYKDYLKIVEMADRSIRKICMESALSVANDCRNRWREIDWLYRHLKTKLLLS